MEENTKPAFQAGSIKETISKKIKEANPEVLIGLIDTLVQEEVSKRKDMVKKGIEKYEELESSYKKMKPDNVTYNQDGSEASKLWSKDALDKFNKAGKEIESLNNALNSAINEANYVPLSKIVK